MAIDPAWPHCPECGLLMVLAGADYVCVRDRMATPAVDLANAIIDLCWKATPMFDANSTTAYLVPAGAMHRLIGRAQSAGIPAAFRSIGGPSQETAPPEAVPDAH